MRNSGIGGQAVIEGVMMRNKDQYAVAVRTPDQGIIVEKKEWKSFADKHKFARLPIIRGVVAFVESMVVGIRTLTFAASFFEEEDSAKDAPQKTKQELEKEAKQKETKEKVTMGFTVFLSFLIAIAIFMLLPYYASHLLAGVVESETLLALIEGALRMVIFVAYVLVISQMEDIKRVFMYHGAEHKSINCIENGLPLTVENAKTQSREHKRCGTSFLLYVMILSVIFFIFIRVDSPLWRVLFRLLLIPVIAGVSYEFIKLAGSSNSKVMAVLSRPGFWLQGLTTREPEDEMLEVAIRSVEAVFDWRAFLAQDGIIVPEDAADVKEETGQQEAVQKKGKSSAARKNKKKQQTAGNRKAAVRQETAAAAETDAAVKEKEATSAKASVKTEPEKASEKAEPEKASEKAEPEKEQKVEAETEKEAADTKEPVTEEAVTTFSEEEPEVVHRAKVLSTGVRGHGGRRKRTLQEELNQLSVRETAPVTERRLNQEEFEGEEEDEFLSALDHFFEDQNE